MVAYKIRCTVLTLCICRPVAFNFYKVPYGVHKTASNSMGSLRRPLTDSLRPRWRMMRRMKQPFQSAHLSLIDPGPLQIMLCNPEANSVYSVYLKYLMYLVQTVKSDVLLGSPGYVATRKNSNGND